MKEGLAADIYFLQEDGIPLVESQQELTPFQRQVLVKEKIRQEKEKEKEMDQARSGNSPSRMNQISGRKNARSDKAQAIKDSQEEREKFVNKSVVDSE